MNELSIDKHPGHSSSHFQVYVAHNRLLSKGLALSHPISIHQALEGNLPMSQTAHEHSFLYEFISGSQETAGGRLAK